MTFDHHSRLAASLRVMRSPFYKRYCRSNPAGAIAAQGMNLAGREVKEMAENTYNVGIYCRLSNDDDSSNWYTGKSL